MMHEMDETSIMFLLADKYLAHQSHCMGDMSTGSITRLRPKGVCYETNKKHQQKERKARGRRPRNASVPLYFPLSLHQKKYEWWAFWMHVKQHECIFGQRAWLSDIAAIVSNQKENNTDTAVWKKGFLPGFICGLIIVELKKKNKNKTSLAVLMPNKCCATERAGQNDTWIDAACIDPRWWSWLGWDSVPMSRGGGGGGDSGVCRPMTKTLKQSAPAERRHKTRKSNNKTGGGRQRVCVCQSELQRWEGLRCRVVPFLLLLLFPRSPPPLL